ncbi:hypothetical protein HDU91_005219, partial [Kappamyces sp. JEL0680]
GEAGGDSAAVFEHLKQLNPSAIDVEIRSLPQDADLIQALVQAIKAQLETKRDFELTLSYLNVVLKVWCDW